MRFLLRSLVAVFLLAVTLAILGLAAQQVRSGMQARLAEKAAPRLARERVFTAPVQTVRAGTVVPELQVFGEVRARRTLDIRAPRSGRVIWVHDGFEEGAEVRDGQLLLRLDPSDARAALDLALADRAKAQADSRDAGRALALARDELVSAQAQATLRQAAVARQRNLRDRGVGSDAALETAELAAQAAEQAVLSRRQSVVTAEARVDQAGVALQRLDITIAEAERTLAELDVYAGISGRLAGVAAMAGGLVGQNERLVQIVDPDQLEVAARLSTAQYARLVTVDGTLPDLPVVAELDVVGVRIAANGVLQRSAATVGAGQAGRMVFATLEAAPGFRPGDFVALRLSEPAIRGVAVLPAAALGPDGTVLALGADDRLEAVPVVLERRQKDTVIVRAEALEGREVVSERNALLGAGVRIRPVRPAEAAAPEGPELLEITPERRAALIAFVEANNRMPAEAKARILSQLSQPRVPAQVVERLESRMGG